MLEWYWTIIVKLGSECQGFIQLSNLGVNAGALFNCQTWDWMPRRRIRSIVKAELPTPRNGYRRTRGNFPLIKIIIIWK